MEVDAANITFQNIAMAFIQKVDPTTLTLILVICILAWLLFKTINRMDAFFTEISASGKTMNSLTALLQQMVYGRPNKPFD